MCARVGHLRGRQSGMADGTERDPARLVATGGIVRASEYVLVPPGEIRHAGRSDLRTALPSEKNPSFNCDFCGDLTDMPSQWI